MKYFSSFFKNTHPYPTFTDYYATTDEGIIMSHLLVDDSDGQVHVFTAGYHKFVRDPKTGGYTIVRIGLLADSSNSINLTEITEQQFLALYNI